MAAMDDLVRWLGKQLAEDERIAQATLWDDDASLGSGRWVAYDRGPRDGFREARWVVIDGADEGVVDSRPQAAEDEAVAKHIAEWDPARVLREIAARRAIVDDLAEEIRWAARMSADYRDGANACERTLKRLALPYIDRPGYREEWRP